MGEGEVGGSGAMFLPKSFIFGPSEIAKKTSKTARKETYIMQTDIYHWRFSQMLVSKFLCNSQKTRLGNESSITINVWEEKFCLLGGQAKCYLLRN